MTYEDRATLAERTRAALVQLGAVE
jgi:hypothetical protein